MVHVEAFFSPADFAHHNLEPQRIAEAIRTGLSRVDGISVSLVADLVRDFGAESGMRTLEQIAEVLDTGIIGIGLGGSEHVAPPEPFAPVFARSRQLGLHTTAHAGEAAGPASVWGVLEALEVERIGHGIRAVEDPALVAHLAQSRVPLEVCPVSNLRTGVVRDPRRHPVRELVDQGVPVTIASDDPEMFETSLANEHLLLRRELGFSRDAVRQLILAGIDASWASNETQEELRRRLTADPAWYEECPTP